MRRSRHVKLTALVLVVLVIAALGLFWSSSRQRAQIRVRYQQMTVALSAGDTNAVLALVAPACRSGFDDLRLSRLEGFAKPLGPQSSILVVGHEATVWPVCTSHYLVWPGGHTVEMVKVNGEWFFTGKVHLD